MIVGIVPDVIGILVDLVTLTWLGLAIYAVRRGGRPLEWKEENGSTNAVSLLVPLHGGFDGLERCLEGFFSQDHPHYEIVVGSSDPEDPALRAISECQHRHPGIPLEIVVTDPAPAGTNPKVANLVGMMRAARHSTIVLIDADILIRPDHLTRVTAPLRDPRVGLVTCPYGARRTRRGSFWQTLAALYVGDWFYTSVLVGTLLAPEAHGFGATLALRRDTLEAIGGFRSLLPVIADDHELARRVRAMGLKTGILECGVQTLVGETSLRSLWSHELRWLGTIRALDPKGYLGLPMTLTTVPAVLALLLLGARPWTWAVLIVIYGLRLVLHFMAWSRSWSEKIPGAILFLPLRDVLTFGEWLVGLVTRRLRWKEALLAIDDRGNLEQSGP